MFDRNKSRKFFHRKQWCTSHGGYRRPIVWAERSAPLGCSAGPKYRYGGVIDVNNVTLKQNRNTWTAAFSLSSITWWNLIFHSRRRRVSTKHSPLLLLLHVRGWVNTKTHNERACTFPLVDRAKSYSRPTRHVLFSEFLIIRDWNRTPRRYKTIDWLIRYLVVLMSIKLYE